MEDIISVRRQIQLLISKFFMMCMLAFFVHFVGMWALKRDSIYLMYAGILFGATLIENALLMFPKMSGIIVSMWRYAEFACCVAMMLNSRSIASSIVFTTVATTFNIAFFMSVGYENINNRLLYLVAITIPIELCAVSYNLLYPMGMVTFISLVMGLSVYIFFSYSAAWLIASVTCKCMKRIEEKQHIIDELKKANQVLEQHQIDMQDANEQLFEQKRQLEVANEEIRNVNARMTLQNAIIEKIATSFHVEELLNETTKMLLEEMQMDFCNIVLYSNALWNGEANIRISSRYGGAFDRSMKQAIEKQEFQKLLGEDTYYVDNFVINDKYPWLDHAIIGSILVFSILREQEPIGYICVGHPMHRFFTDQVMLFFETIAMDCIVALKNISLYQQTKHCAVYDPMTGLVNRGSFMKLLQQEIADSMSQHTSAVVVLFDLDHFKRVNDTYGYNVADQVILEITKTVVKLASVENGIVGRYDGEEFAIIWKNCSEGVACSRMKQIHEGIRKIQFKNGEFSVTISSGITVFPDTCKNPKEILKNADIAMRYSKQNGRDRFTVDSQFVRNAVDMY